METLAATGEFALIERLRRVLEEEGCKGADILLGIGDDAAVLSPRPGYELLVSCDVQVEGRHYLPEYVGAGERGERAMAVNLSDVAAMGGWPRWALVSLGLSGEVPVDEVSELYRGLARQLNPFAAALVGGNLARVEDAAFIDITLIGEVEAGRALRRSGARPGDAILVTGYPGQAGAGLRLLRQEGGKALSLREGLVRAYTAPRARVRAGREAALSGQVSAMIDLSDGFPGDLRHLCKASGVGAQLREEALPLSADLRWAAARWGEDPLDLFLQPSDDYELMLSCAAESAPELAKRLAASARVPVAVVGRITASAGEIELVGPQGEARVLDCGGWDHFG